MQRQQDIGAELRGLMGGAASITAGGAGDNAVVNGPWASRTNLTTTLDQGVTPGTPGAEGKRRALCLSCKVQVGYTATLANGQTLTIDVKLQDAADTSGTGAADFGTAGQAVVAAPSGGGTVSGVAEIDIELTAAREAIRAVWTPNLSAATTDTALLGCIVTLGGSDAVPISTRLNARQT